MGEPTLVRASHRHWNYLKGVEGGIEVLYALKTLGIKPFSKFKGGEIYDLYQESGVTKTSLRTNSANLISGGRAPLGRSRHT